jgi:endo-1,4-beta-xylanase
MNYPNTFLATIVFLILCSCSNKKQSQSAALDDDPLTWTTENPMLSAFMFEEETDWISIKDPSIVRYNDKWHLFCTLRGKERSHAIVYNSFDAFENAQDNKPVVLPNHAGYFCAPQVFFYSPQQKWYMICQAKSEDWSPNYQAAFATTTNIEDPASWSALQPMQLEKPKDDMYLDFWVIADDEKVYNFFTCDNGKMYRSSTSPENFPLGWSKPELAFVGDIFEASHIYYLPKQDLYLNLIEAQMPDDRRYFKAFTATRLDGDWKPIGTDSIGTYASAANVIQKKGPWTNGISHGELVRNGVDEKMEASFESPFVFQGVLHRNREGKKYGDIPWQLGVLYQTDDKSRARKEHEDAPLHHAANYPVGTSIRLELLRNDSVMDIAGYEFNSMTAGNAMKMHRVLRDGFRYDFTEADEYLRYAEDHNMRMFGHMLLWHNATPDFVQNLEGDSTKLYEFTAKYIDTLVSRYKGRIDAWDVVNEPVLDQTSDLRENTWFNTFGEDYLEMAFRMAHKADPTAKLFLNDFNIERDTAKLHGFLKIVNNLKSKGVPIHGIGMQMHIRMDIPNETIEYALKKCVETGLLIHFSELDIIFNKHNDQKGGGIQVYENLTAEMKTQQAEKYKQIARMYNEIVPRDQQYGITLWGFADKYTWIRYFFDIDDWPLIYDDKLQKKEAYFGFREGLFVGR